ncbi:unnamed protein product, partial [Ixodes pacificus]
AWYYNYRLITEDTKQPPRRSEEDTSTVLELLTTGHKEKKRLQEPIYEMSCSEKEKTTKTTTTEQ